MFIFGKTLNMNVCLVQMNIAWGDVEGNLACLGSMLQAVSGVDLYVLPEMFTTGFATSSEALVETEPSAGLEWMKAFAANRNAAVCGSLALRLGSSGECVNRMYFVTPDGKAAVYDKRHLFGYGGEKERFSAGSRRVVVEYRGVRFLLSVCYDLRFPVWLRNRKDYDAMIVVANWPAARRTAWDVLVRARAVENQCHVLAVNRVGTDPSCAYDGGTMAVGPDGGVAASVPDGACGICKCCIDMDGLRSFRKRFPVFDDADSFILVP